MNAITDETAIKSVLDDYDWREAMDYCDWEADDVAEIIAMSEGENDGCNWLMAVKLKNGNFGFLSAGCDYTGWDCQAGGNSDQKGSLEELIRMGMGGDDRDRLGFSMPA